MNTAAEYPSAAGELTKAECWKLLHRSSLGRLATADDGRADIFPVNFVVDRRSVILRTAPGRKLTQLLDAPEVAFEADGHDSERYWSVVIRGTAKHVRPDEHPPAVVPWFPAEHYDVIRITPRSVVGRSIERARFGDESVFG